MMMQTVHNAFDTALFMYENHWWLRHLSLDQANSVVGFRFKMLQLLSVIREQIGARPDQYVWLFTFFVSLVYMAAWARLILNWSAFGGAKGRSLVMLLMLVFLPFVGVPWALLAGASHVHLADTSDMDSDTDNDRVNSTRVRKSPRKQATRTNC